MKKALSIFSAILIFMIIMSVCAFGAEPDQKLASLGQKAYYTGVSFTAKGEISVDGRIDESEGWVCVTPDFVSKTATSLEYRFNSWEDNSGVEALGEDKNVYASSFKYYVAQNDTDIYFAIEDFAPYFEVDGREGFTMACESLCRNFYNVRLGFDVEHYDRYIHIRLEDALDQINICDRDSYKSIKDTYTDMVTYGMARFAADGTHISDGNDNKTNQHYWVKPAHQWVARIECKLNKELIKKAYVEYFGEGSDANVDFTSMFVSASAAGSIANPSISNEYSLTFPIYGTLLTKAEATENELVERVIPDLVVFAKDPNAVEETDVATQHVPGDDQPPVEKLTYDSESSQDSEYSDYSEQFSKDIYDLAVNACTGTVSRGGIALVIALGACTALIVNKKED